MSQRISSLADELRLVIRLAARDPEALEGELPTLSAMHRVVAAGDLDEAGRVHRILHRLIPEYLERLPGGRDCMAIRELLMWEDGDGEARSLTTRYHKASAHLVNAGHDFGRRQEPRLLLECARRFVALDHDDRLEALSPPPAAPVEEGEPRNDDADPQPATPLHPPELPAPRSAGIARVHKTLDYQLLTDYMADADEIVILNTWIPELSILADAIVDALARGTYVSILMLYPESSIARLRTEALQGSMQPPFREDQVQPGVRHCLEVLAAIASMAGERRRRHLKVRLYDSLPSIAVYAVDDRAFVSLFLHGQLAFRSVQIEIEGQESLMGAVVFRELETLWKIGQQFEDVTQWQTELLDMARRFEIPR
jgi:hypothetical protein